MVSEFKTNLSNNIELNNVVEIDIANVAYELVNHPAFIAAIAKEIRNQMTKDARFMGNLFAKWAQTNPPLPSSKKRIN